VLAVSEVTTDVKFEPEEVNVPARLPDDVQLAE
jgi:hypothetical protein